MDLNWISDSSFEIGGHIIVMDYEVGGSKRLSDDAFTIMKTRSFFDHYTALKGRGYNNIIELGVYQGGSVVFIDQLLKPKKFSAVELENKPIPSLDKYVAKNSDRLKIHYGTSQDDVACLKKIVADDLGGRLDLVVDDASHWYQQTKTSFTTLFPLLAPGGLYIIEDWSWSFDLPYQEPTNDWYRQPAPANLVLELLEDMAMRQLIQSIHVERELIKIYKAVNPAGDLFSSQARRGRTLPLL
jgi:hypothetical protein